MSIRLLGTDESAWNCGGHINACIWSPMSAMLVTYRRERGQLVRPMCASHQLNVGYEENPMSVIASAINA